MLQITCIYRVAVVLKIVMYIYSCIQMIYEYSSALLSLSRAPIVSIVKYHTITFDRHIPIVLQICRLSTFHIKHETVNVNIYHHIVWRNSDI